MLLNDLKSWTIGHRRISLSFNLGVTLAEFRADYGLKLIKWQQDRRERSMNHTNQHEVYQSHDFVDRVLPALIRTFLGTEMFDTRTVAN